MVPAKKFPWWFFNSYMLWGAALGWLITESVGELLETASHKGSAVVAYDDGSERVLPESAYKRKRYGEGGMILFIGLLLWGHVASAHRDK